jgi:hypothetical protein
MLVKIVKETTSASYGLLERGQVVQVDEKHFTEKTFRRWIRRGIAVEVIERDKVESKVEPKAEAPIDKTVYVTDVVEDTESPELEEMTFQELRKYARENGYENYGKMNRDQLIELLTEEDEVEESNPFFDGNE